MIQNPKDWRKFLLVDPFHHPMPGAYQDCNFLDYDTGRQKRGVQQDAIKIENEIESQPGDGDLDKIFDEAENLSDEEKKSSDSAAEQSVKSESESDEDGQTGEEDFHAFNRSLDRIGSVGSKRKVDMKKQILRLCVLRVMRPDLLVTLIKEFILLFLDKSFVQTPNFSF
jgi:hypothetical protein